MNNFINVKVKKLPHFDDQLGEPFYGSPEAAGADIKVSLPLDQRLSGLLLGPGEKILVPSGLCFEIPHGYEIQVRPRSGLSLKTGLFVANSPGTIDSDYRGEVKIILANLGNKIEKILHGDRIAQIVIAPVWRMNFTFSQNLSESHRAESGFGSTGRGQADDINQNNGKA